MMVAAPGRARSTAPWTVRVAMWSARHRWPVIAGWFVCTLGLFVVSMLMGGEIKGDGPEVESKLVPIPGLVAQMRVENPGFQIYALNNTLANNEISTVINNDLDGSLRLTIPLTFLILLVAFGAVVAAAVP